MRYECLAEALDNRIEWGVWGGMTERERRLLLRQRADVVSWSSILVGGRPGREAVVAGAQSLSDRRPPTARRVPKSVTSVGND